MPFVARWFCAASLALVSSGIWAQSEPVATLPDEVLRVVRRSFGPDELPALQHQVDLNGDGRPELLLYLLRPQGCAQGPGCHLLIFSPGPRGYQMVGDIQPVPLPLRLSPNKTRGWQHLLVSTGTGMVEMAYQGSSFARDPRVPGPGVRNFVGGEAITLLPAQAAVDAPALPPMP